LCIYSVLFGKTSRPVYIALMGIPVFRQHGRQSAFGWTGRGLQLAGDGIPRQPSGDTRHPENPENTGGSPIALWSGGNMRGGGFSLLELLTVIAIISILTGVSAISLRGISGGSHLLTGGAQIANFLESAREMAILKKAPVAVALLANGEDVGGRVFTALEYLPDANQWARVSKWESLPNGVLAYMTNNDACNAFSPTNSPTLSVPLPPLTKGTNTYSPQNASGYGYIVFLPNGSLYQDASLSSAQPSVFRLVEGVSTSSGAQYTGAKGADDKPVNYFEIVINECTGRVKTVRP